MGEIRIVVWTRARWDERRFDVFYTHRRHQVQSRNQGATMTCKHCQKPFLPKHGNQLYCSKQCYTKAKKIYDSKYCAIYRVENREHCKDIQKAWVARQKLKAQTVCRTCGSIRYSWQDIVKGSDKTRCQVWGHDLTGIESTHFCSMHQNYRKVK